MEIKTDVFTTKTHELKLTDKEFNTLVLAFRLASTVNHMTAFTTMAGRYCIPIMSPEDMVKFSNTLTDHFRNN